MKPSFYISVCALLLSVASLAVTLCRQPSTIFDAEVDRIVNAALARKEKAYVDAMAPKMESIYRDMLGPRYKPFQKPPDTLEQLFEPVVQILNGMTAGE